MGLVGVELESGLPGGVGLWPVPVAWVRARGVGIPAGRVAAVVLVPGLGTWWWGLWWGPVRTLGEGLGVTHVEHHEPMRHGVPRMHAPAML